MSIAGPSEVPPPTHAHAHERETIPSLASRNSHVEMLMLQRGSPIIPSISSSIDVVARRVQQFSFLCRRLLLRGLGSFFLCLLDDDLLPDEPLAEFAEEVVEDDSAGDDADEYDNDDDGSVHC